MRDDPIGGRRFLVTGSSSGIGQAVTHLLLERGGHVTGLSRQPERGVGEHEHFHPVSIDLADLASLERRLGGDLREVVEGVDGAILAAGAGRFGSLEEFSTRQIRSLVDLDFTAQACLARAILPAMKRRGRGDLIFVGSEAALAGKREGALYCACKFALRGLAQALREECAPAGVRVGIVHPGPVRTPFFDGLPIEPGDGPGEALEAGVVARALVGLLEQPAGTLIDELVISPQRPVIRKRGKSSQRPPGTSKNP